MAGSDDSAFKNWLMDSFAPMAKPIAKAMSQPAKPGQSAAPSTKLQNPPPGNAIDGLTNFLFKKKMSMTDPNASNIGSSVNGAQYGANLVSPAMRAMLGVS